MVFRKIRNALKRTGEPQARKTLLLHDMEDEAHILTIYLNHMRWEVVSAVSREVATAALKHTEFDLLFVGTQIAGTNGLSFVRALREQAAFARLPVVFLAPALCAGDSMRIRRKLDRTSILAPPYSSSSVTCAIRKAMGYGSGSERRRRRPVRVG